MIVPAQRLDEFVSMLKRKFSEPCVVSPSLAERIDALFQVCKDLKPRGVDYVLDCEHSEYKELWLRLPRGKFEDYRLPRKQHKYWKSGLNPNQKFYEDMDKDKDGWLQIYPDEYIWYNLGLWTRDDCRSVCLNGKALISALGIQRDYVETDTIACWLCDTLIKAAEESMDLLRSGTYNEWVSAELPYRYRFGLIWSEYVGETGDKEYDEGAYSDLVSIVPHYVSSDDGHYMISDTKYGNVFAFMHVDDADIEAFGDKIEWDEVEQAELLSSPTGHTPMMEGDLYAT